MMFEFNSKIDRRDKLQRTALHHAVKANNETAIRFLMTQTKVPPKKLLADVTNGGETPLMKAAEFCSVEVIHLLLSNGADPFVKNIRGRTAD